MSSIRFPVALAMALAITCLLDAAPGACEPRILHLDRAASRAEYHITHTLKDVTDVAGTSEGHVRVDTAGGVWRLEGRASVDLRALVTGNGTRDRHVKSSDYLDVERFPTATFRIVEAIADPSLAVASDSMPAAWIGRVRGPLQVHGIEHMLEVPMRLDAVPGRDGALRARGRFILQLADFAIPRPKKLMFAAGTSVDVSLDFLFVP